MKRSILVVYVAVVAVGVAAPAARADMHEISGQPGDLVLTVLKGEVWLFEGGVPEDASRDWDFVAVPGETSIQLKGGLRAHFLAFDPAGESRRVTLTSARDMAWLLAKAEGGVTTYTVRAGEGKLKGWYLDREAKGRHFKTRDGKRCTGYRAVLSKKPRIPKFFVVEIAH